MSCTYTYPNGHSVQKAFWSKKLVTEKEPPDLLDDPEYRGRALYLGDEQHDCTLRLKNVREKDQSKYYFRFITDQSGGKWQGKGGVDLLVYSDLQVEVPERVIEGDKVTLTCKTTCSLTVRPTFTWYRNGHHLSSSTDQLHLQSVSREDAGRYHCAVLGQNSPEVTLNVRYGPKNVSVSISSSGEIVEGDSAMMMSLRMTPPTSLVFLLLIYGVVAQDGWAVYYNSKSICALKGSAVTMSCTYTPPSGHSVQKAFWTKNWITDVEPPDLLDDPEYRGRVQYLGDKQHSCTLRLSDVTEKDQSKYYFRFITNQPKGKYQGAGGVDLSVTDLQVELPERVIEGDKVTLTCRTTCSLTVRTTFTWYRNGHRLSSRTDQLHLQSVSREDAGRYRCAVLGLNLRSPEVTLNVRCKYRWPKEYFNSISIIKE
ncbi:sialoadhesin-like [Colossoma macropomum]|uniref:sialoadhesin-like n=1 Tax=Colossoma macropomum TaxID=42526 RepID=UPI001864F14C|nr:sialoadhesin-like [Colossoma macropomum]